MRVSAIAALLGVALATGYGESSQAGVIGPGDFGPDAVVQTFDSLTENYFGTYGPLVLDGVTYATSSVYNTAGGSDCFSGQCFGTRSQGALLTIELDNPVERVGGYLHGRGDQTPYAIFYDANHVALGGLSPNLVSGGAYLGGSFFFGFESDSNDIKFIELAPNSGVFIATLDNFAYEMASPVPGPIAGAGLPGLILASVGLLGWWRRKRNGEAAA
jgi:hypothetical protein